MVFLSRNTYGVLALHLPAVLWMAAMLLLPQMRTEREREGKEKLKKLLPGSQLNNAAGKKRPNLSMSDRFPVTEEKKLSNRKPNPVAPTQQKKAMGTYPGRSNEDSTDFYSKNSAQFPDVYDFEEKLV